MKERTNKFDQDLIKTGRNGEIWEGLREEGTDGYGWI